MTTVKVHGREMAFSEEELKSVLEDYFAPKPQEGKWFEVNPLAIDQELFEWKRKDRNQEKVRQIILDAFVEVYNNPEYAKPFRTTFPTKNWETKKVSELKELANQMGDHIADWVEQALEWAQRIANGESWESLCNEPDITNCYRLVLSKYDEHEWIVGGALLFEANCPATDIEYCTKEYYDKLKYTVPLVVKYK